MSVLDKVILGVSDTHDASAAIVHRGQIVCAVAEERIQRVKSVGGFPKGAIEECLRYAGLTYSDIDYIAVAGNRAVPVNMLGTTSSFGIGDFLAIQEKLRYPRFYQNEHIPFKAIFPEFEPKGNPYYSPGQIPLKETSELDSDEAARISDYRREFISKATATDESRIKTFDHHTCHAYYSYYASPIRDRPVAAVTLDSGGDGAYETVSIFDEKGAFKQIHKGHECIVGPIYSMVTLLLRMRPFEHEFKVMGLAPYAKEHVKKNTREALSALLKIDGLGFRKSAHLRDYYFHIAELLKLERFDGIAGGLQDWTEQVLIEWFSNILNRTGCRDVVFSGGVALNVKANLRLLELDSLNSIFIPPGAGDESLAIGAAWALLDDLNPAGEHRPEIQPLQNGYLGPDVVDRDIEDFEHHPAVKHRFTRVAVDPDRFAAEALLNNEIVAVCRDRMEFGPRALGSRSLIANPSSLDSVRKINEAIKGRDFWMPFAPSILAERGADYVCEQGKCDFSYMTFCADSTSRAASELAATIHPYDRTLRVQFVERSACPRYHSLIGSFFAISGIPAVLNTSLNIHGKPIVMTPIDLANELLADPKVELRHLVVGNAAFSRNDVTRK